VLVPLLCFLSPAPRPIPRPRRRSRFPQTRRGRSAQGFRDPGFLGIANPENDAVYLPLKKGSNELMLAVSELGGGWGFICRLVDLEN
jgi:hypothetical protein